MIHCDYLESSTIRSWRGYIPSVNWRKLDIRHWHSHCVYIYIPNSSTSICVHIRENWIRYDKLVCSRSCLACNRRPHDIHKSTTTTPIHLIHTNKVHRNCVSYSCTWNIWFSNRKWKKWYCWLEIITVCGIVYLWEYCIWKWNCVWLNDKWWSGTRKAIDICKCSWVQSESWAIVFSGCCCKCKEHIWICIGWLLLELNIWKCNRSCEEWCIVNTAWWRCKPDKWIHWT